VISEAVPGGYANSPASYSRDSLKMKGSLRNVSVMPAKAGIQTWSRVPGPNDTTLKNLILNDAPHYLLPTACKSPIAVENRGRAAQIYAAPVRLVEGKIDELF
jgi:hypothetical protein